MQPRLAKLRAHLSYGNVVATLALFVALGGTSVAALRISGKDIRPRTITGRQVKDRSLSARQLRDRSLTARKTRNGSLTGRVLAPESIGSGTVAGLRASDFAAGELPAAMRPDATRPDTTSPDAIPATLPSGKTLKGVFAASVTGGPETTPSSSGGNVARTPVPFPIPLASAPAATYVYAEQPSPPRCPGTAADPQATPGNLCLYEARAFGELFLQGFFNPVTGANFEASRFGAVAFVNGLPGAGIRGTWAVTAP